MLPGSLAIAIGALLLTGCGANVVFAEDETTSDGGGGTGAGTGGEGGCLTEPGGCLVCPSTRPASGTGCGVEGNVCSYGTGCVDTLECTSFGWMWLTDPCQCMDDVPTC